MSLQVSTPALLFPAISLLFLSFTNRFLHLSALIRTLHARWREEHSELIKDQIENLRKRLVLIRWMQFLGALSLFLCVTAMLTILANWHLVGGISFCAALVLMAGSLLCLIREVSVSGGALEILLQAMEEEDQQFKNPSSKNKKAPAEETTEAL